MKFSLIAVATLAIAGMASAVHPVPGCTKTVRAEHQSLAAFAKAHDVKVVDVMNLNGLEKQNAQLGNRKVCIEGPAAASDAESKFEAKAKKQPKKQPKKKNPPKSGNPPKGIKKRAGQSSKRPANSTRRVDPKCNLWCTVLKTDIECGGFAKSNGISEERLYDLNPGLHRVGEHRCDNLDTGKAYCVSTRR
ncbi:unnamed protein product [Cunninghamella blakesleeana]